MYQLIIASTAVSNLQAEKKDHPTSPFTLLEPQSPWIGEFYVVRERRETDFKAPKF